MYGDLHSYNSTVYIHKLPQEVGLPHPPPKPLFTLSQSKFSPFALHSNLPLLFPAPAMKTPTGLSRSLQLRALASEFIDTDIIHMVTETGADP